MIEGKHRRHLLAGFERLFQPVALRSGNRRRVIRVEKDQRQIIAEIEAGVARLGIQPVEDRVEEGSLVPRPAEAAQDFVVADSPQQRNHPPLRVAQVAGVVLEKLQEDLGRFGVFVGDVARHHDEHGRLGRRHVIRRDGMLVDAAVAAGDEMNRVGRLGRHRAEPLFGRVESHVKSVVGSRLEPAQLGPQDPAVGQRKPPRGRRLLLPDFGPPLGKPDRPTDGILFLADPLNRHRGRRVPLPRQKQGGRLIRRLRGKSRRRLRPLAEHGMGVRTPHEKRSRLQKPPATQFGHRDFPGELQGSATRS